MTKSEEPFLTKNNINNAFNARLEIILKIFPLVPISTNAWYQLVPRLQPKVYHYIKSVLTHRNTHIFKIHNTYRTKRS